MFLGKPSQCRHCGATTLWRSRSTRGGGVARFVLLYPIRCGHCDRVFWQFTLFPPPFGTRSRAKPADSGVVASHSGGKSGANRPH